MVLSYARGSWQFKVASLVASSVAVAVRYGNVGGNFSGNEALVASLMAECDGKNGGNRILVAKGVATLHGKNWAGSLAITFWRQQRCQNLMAAFWAEKVANTFSHKKALSVHGTCWQKGCERLFCVAGVALMALGWLWWRAPPVLGRRGTWRHVRAFCVAGAALGDIHLLSRTIFHTPLCHTPSFTHHLWHTIFHTPSLSHTIFHTPAFTHHLSPTFVSHTHTHTRQEWIIIWSGRNWILKHAD